MEVVKVLTTVVVAFFVKIFAAVAMRVSLMTIDLHLKVVKAVVVAAFCEGWVKMVAAVELVEVVPVLEKILGLSVETVAKTPAVHFVGAS